MMDSVQIFIRQPWKRFRPRSAIDQLGNPFIS